MHDALDVARHLVWVAGHTRGSPLAATPMHLQKWLYYAQGWHLGMFGGPVFHGSIEAWRFGPVVPPVYREFKAFGSGPIGQAQSRAIVNLDWRSRIFFEWIINRYGHFPADELSAQTHRDPPWRDAWEARSHDARGHVAIGLESLQTCFADKVKKLNDFFKQDIAMVIQSIAEAREGKTVSLDFLRESLSPSPAKSEVEGKK